MRRAAYAAFAHDVIAAANRGDSVAISAVLAPRCGADGAARLAESTAMLTRQPARSTGLAAAIARFVVASTTTTPAAATISR